MTDPYAVLGVARGASRDEVRAAYRRLARRWHPDLHAKSGAESRADAERRMKDLNAAYDEILSGRAAANAAYEAYTRWRAPDDRFHGASAHAAGGPTLMDSLRELRDLMLGRQSPPLTVDEVARRLRTSPLGVLKLIERGALQASWLAGSVRVTGEALANYLLGRGARR